MSRALKVSKHPVPCNERWRTDSLTRPLVPQRSFTLTPIGCRSVTRSVDRLIAKASLSDAAGERCSSPGDGRIVSSYIGLSMKDG